jgi:hypothetical protein
MNDYFPRAFIFYNCVFLFRKAGPFQVFLAYPYFCYLSIQNIIRSFQSYTVLSATCMFYFVFLVSFFFNTYIQFSLSFILSALVLYIF